MSIWTRQEKKCPDCNKPLDVKAFNEATIYECECGYVEAWHRVACEDNPQISRRERGRGGRII